MSGSAHSAALDLEAWLGTLKSWAAGVARRRRRPDLAEDIESAAVELMLARGQMGVVPDPEVERVIAAELELADNFSTARDSDLTAAANERFDRETVGS